MKLRLAEKFASVNGEGKKAGEAAVFIRFSGCNLKCSYCDTRWALEEDSWKEELSMEDLLDYLKGTGIQNITLTGGEPLLQKNINEIVRALLDEGYHIEIETNGSQQIDTFEFYDYGNVSFTVDYKLPGSGQEQKMCLANYGLLSLKDSVKFVITDHGDLRRAHEMIKQYHLTERTTVFLSAAFSRINNQEIVEYMLAHKINGAKLQLQLHKYIWSPETQGV